MRKVYTSRFGEMEVDEKKIVHFKDGIPAFEDEHEFVILPYEEDSPYYFMQSLKSPDLAFLLTIPFLFFNDYTFELDDVTVKELGIKESENVFYYTMITIGSHRPQRREHASQASRPGKEQLYDQAPPLPRIRQKGGVNPCLS